MATFLLSVALLIIGFFATGYGLYQWLNSGNRYAPLWLLTGIICIANAAIGYLIPLGIVSASNQATVFHFKYFLDILTVAAGVCITYFDGFNRH